MKHSFVLYCIFGFLFYAIMGREDRQIRKCKNLYSAEVPAVQMCSEKQNNYSSNSTNVYVNKSTDVYVNNIRPNSTASCSCEISIHPIPQSITRRYRSSLNGGCRLTPLFNTSFNDSLECVTEKIAVNETADNELLLWKKTQKFDSFLCFGIQIEGEEISVKATCSPAQTSSLAPDDDLDSVQISSQLTMHVAEIDEVQVPALILTFSVNISYDKKHYDTSSADEDTTHKAVEGNDTTDNENKSSFATGPVIAIASSVIGFTLLLSIVLIRRCKRSGLDQKSPTVNYAVTAQRDTSDDIVITDNVAYNLGEDVMVNNTDISYPTRVVDSMEVNGSESCDVEYSSKGQIEDEYVNTQSGSMSQTSVSSRSNKTGKNLEILRQDFRTDDEKMELYSNRHISKNIKSRVDDDQVYSN